MQCAAQYRWAIGKGLAMALLIHLIGHVIADSLLRRGMKIGWIRWVCAILFTLFGAACVALEISTPDTIQQFGFGIGASFFILAILIWIAVIRYRVGISTI